MLSRKNFNEENSNAQYSYTNNNPKYVAYNGASSSMTPHADVRMRQSVAPVENLQNNVKYQGYNLSAYAGYSGIDGFQTINTIKSNRSTQSMYNDRLDFSVPQAGRKVPAVYVNPQVMARDTRVTREARMYSR